MRWSRLLAAGRDRDRRGCSRSRRRPVRRATTYRRARRSTSSRRCASSINETLSLFKQGKDAQALRAVAGGLPEPLRVRRDPAARRGSAVHTRRRVEVRRGPPGDPGRPHRRRAGPHHRAARHHRRGRAPTLEPRLDRAAARHEPVLPHHLPRGTRSGPAALGAARLPGGGEGDPVPATDPVGRRPRGARDRS